MISEHAVILAQSRKCHKRLVTRSFVRIGRTCLSLRLVSAARLPEWLFTSYTLLSQLTLQSLVTEGNQRKHVPSKENFLAISIVRSDIAHQDLSRTHSFDSVSSIFACLFGVCRSLRIRAHETSRWLGFTVLLQGNSKRRSYLFSELQAGRLVSRYCAIYGAGSRDCSRKIQRPLFRRQPPENPRHQLSRRRKFCRAANAERQSVQLFLVVQDRISSASRLPGSYDLAPFRWN